MPGSSPGMTPLCVAMLSKSLIGQTIELAALDIAFDLLIEALRLKFLEPRAKAIELARSEFSDRLLDIFKLDHIANIA